MAGNYNSGRQKGPLRRASDHFYKDDNYFAVIRCATPEKFERIASFNKSDFVQSAIDYDEFVGDLINKVIDISNRFETQADFGRWLQKLKVYSNKSNAGVISFSTALYTYREDNFNVQYSLVKKLEVIVKAWDKEYKDVEFIPKSTRKYFDPYKMEKQCSRCKEVKPVYDFYESSRDPSGYLSRCKECDKAAKRAAYHKRKAKEKECMNQN